MRIRRRRHERARFYVSEEESSSGSPRRTGERLRRGSAGGGGGSFRDTERASSGSFRAAGEAGGRSGGGGTSGGAVGGTESDDTVVVCPDAEEGAPGFPGIEERAPELARAARGTPAVPAEEGTSAFPEAGTAPRGAFDRRDVTAEEPTAEALVDGEALDPAAEGRGLVTTVAALALAPAGMPEACVPCPRGSSFAPGPDAGSSAER